VNHGLTAAHIYRIRRLKNNTNTKFPSNANANANSISISSY